jgi:beta-glucanase (GH16 family)
MVKMRLSGAVLVVVFSFGLLHLFSCTKASEPGPELRIMDASQVRNKTSTTIQFHLILAKPAGNDVSVDYSFSDGTAKAPGDYISETGTVVIPANQTEGTITVQLPADPMNVRQPNLQFTVNLSNPKFCVINTPSAKGTIITEDGTYLATDNKGYTTPLTYPGYTLVWSDEFSGNSLDLSSWNQETGTGSGGWGNNELEFYTNNLKNTFLSNGNLIIEARRESIGASNYSSGRMTTENKKFFKFGRIDIRAKLPVGQGIWPALWMLGTKISSAGWPACGEIDIMELIGTTPSTVYGTLHWSSLSGAHVSKGANLKLLSGDYSKEFHVYSIIWGENYIQWFIDDQKYLDISISDFGVAPYPFNDTQFFIFNVAVGGNWPGPPDFTTEFPQRMFVDYVRVFQ